MNVSFVIIAFNEERSIARCIKSILAQQGLGKGNAQQFEIIVVNDGSHDTTAEIVRGVANTHHEINLIDFKENQGRGAARAAGVEAAQGDYLAFIDADIVLPPDWLQRCLTNIQGYDAVGGIAVPDGDATFVYRVFNLTPKVAAQSTTITGNNGFFRKQVFEKVSYSTSKKDGEDVALGYAMKGQGLKAMVVPGLTVDHREMKSYGESLHWLFQSGRGASRQLYEHGELRLPDVAFFGFVFLILLTIATLIGAPRLWFVPAITMLLYVLASSTMHMHTKFELAKAPTRGVAAALVNMTLLSAYYFGRLKGLLTEWKYA